MLHYTDGGLRNVWLVNGYTKHQTPFGPGVAIHDAEGLTAAIGAGLAGKPGRLTGTELRYLRSAILLLSQPALGSLMGVDGQTVARWEKSGRLPRSADRFVRLLVLAQAEGDLTIRRAIERVSTVERLTCQRLVVEQRGARWCTRFDDEAAHA